MLTPAQRDINHVSSTSAAHTGDAVRDAARSLTHSHTAVTIAACLIVACLLTAFEMVQHYRAATTEVESHHNAILHIDAAPLSRSIAQHDTRQAQALIDKIASLPLVDEVRLNRERQTPLVAGQLTSSVFTQTQRPLLTRTGDRNISVGSITLLTDRNAISRQLTAQLGPTLGSNVLRMVLLATLGLLAYHHFIGRHLNALAHSVRENHKEGTVRATPFAGDAIINRPDGVTAIAAALDDARRALDEEYAEQAGRTAALEAENNALRDQLRTQAPLARLGTQAGTVVHDVRNPLAAIRADSKLLTLQLDGASPHVHTALQRINRNAERCDSILRVSRDVASGIPSSSSVCDINALIDRLLAEVDVTGGINLTFTPSDNPLRALIDPDKVEQILTNLIDNAVHATLCVQEQAQITPPEGWCVDVCVGTTDQHMACICVTDHGGGLAGQDLSRCFDPLFTTKADGLGLGLPICVRLAELLGGSLTLTPSLDGTVACLSVPLHNATAD